MLQKLTTKGYRPFRAVFFERQNEWIVFDTRVVGITVIHATTTSEKASRVADMLNAYNRSGEARRLLPEWSSLLDELLASRLEQVAGYDAGNPWARSIASHHRHVARVAETVAELWDAIADGELVRPALVDVLGVDVGALAELVEAVS